MQRINELISDMTVSSPTVRGLKASPAQEDTEHPVINEIIEWYDNTQSNGHRLDPSLAAWRLDAPSAPQGPRPRTASFYAALMLDRAGAGTKEVVAATHAGQKVAATLSSLAQKAPINFKGIGDLPVGATFQTLMQSEFFGYSKEILAGLGPDLCGEMLVFSTMIGASEMATQLLQFRDCLNWQDLVGNTALHWAIITEQKELADKLLLAGANPHLRNSLFAQPSDYGVKFGPERPVVAYLQRQGSRVPLSPDQLRQHTGMQYLEQSRCSVDFFVSLGLMAFSKEEAEPFTRSLPVEEATPIATPLLSLKSYQDLGWGVCATEALPEGSFLGSYLGDILHNAEVVIRERRGFLDYAYGLFQNKRDILEQRLNKYLPIFIDGQEAGSLLTRVNSCSDSGSNNVRLLYGFRRGRPVVDFYAVRPIHPGEQLFFYYGDAYWESGGRVQAKLTRDHDFLATHPVSPYMSPAMTNTLVGLLQSGQYLPMTLSVQNFASRKSLVGTSTRMGYFAEGLLAAQSTGRCWPIFIIPHVHAANDDVRECLEEILLDNDKFFYDEFLQKKIMFGRSAFLFPQRDSTKLPKSSRFHVNCTGE